MEFCFKNTEEFVREFDRYYPLEKCECGGIREMELSTATVIIGEKTIDIHDCPILICQKCRKELIGHRVPMFIYKVCKEFDDHPGNNRCQLTLKGEGRFAYAEKADFIYDSRDLNIPGCDVDLDPTHEEGFSLPVYFDRKVLNSFLTDDEYELDFFSESYGDIAKLGTNGWAYEWKIPFGINANDRVVIFLGDLDQIDDERSIYFMKAYNVPSDHRLVDTELYQAQMKCIFSEPIIEQRIIRLRNGFYSTILKRFGIDLRHLEAEVAEKVRLVTKPVSYSEREVSGNIVALDGILNEGISQDGLRELCTALGETNDIKQLKTRKLLQKVISTKEGEDRAKDIIAPLFHLNDLRVCFAHLLPDEDIQKYKDSIVDAFGLSDFSEYRKLYESLLAELYTLYKYLYVTDFRIQESK